VDEGIASLVMAGPALVFTNDPLLRAGTVDVVPLPVVADVNNKGGLAGAGNTWTVPGGSFGGSLGFVDTFVPVDGVDGVETTTGVDFI
jgi:hypothetical protein